MEINGYPNYLIYEDGKVQNKTRGTFLKPANNGIGYMFVNLWRENKGKCLYIHRLIALHYIPNPEGKQEVDHIDRNPLNNDITNLRWVTSGENGQNISKRSDNNSGHKNISYDKTKSMWVYKKVIRGEMFRKFFTTKTDALCYKYIFLLKN